MRNRSLTDVDYLKQVLSRANAIPKRSMGQNFLICSEVVEATVTALGSGPKIITELGAGLGTLTQAMLAAGFAVRAIEKDDVLVNILRKHIDGHAEVIHGDIKDIDWRPAFDTSIDDQAQGTYQLVGNIPYNISGLIIRRLTQLDPAPAQTILLMQTEVARRLLATPPNMSLISLAVQLWGQAHHLLTVPASCFWPQPKVSSVLVALTPHRAEKTQSTKSEGVTREEIMQLAKICFQNKRKQIGGSLKRASYQPAAIDSALKEAGVPPSARPQELTAGQWQVLYQELSDNT